jgi:hypothetical protein
MIDIDILGPGFTNAFESWNVPANLTKDKCLSINEEHIKRMKHLHASVGMHPARTLDEYADMVLSGKWLEKYNWNQVLSRWFDSHHGQTSHSRLHRHAINFASRLRNWFPGATRERSSTVGTEAFDMESQPQPELDPRFNRLILVVSQLWLFKLGGERPTIDRFGKF